MNRVYPVSIILLLLILTSLSDKTQAQNLPVGTPIEDTYRRMQLLGKLDSSISFTVRPLNQAALAGAVNGNVFDPSGSLNEAFPQGNNGFLYKSADAKSVVQLLPFTIKQQINTHNPYGWNDGSMIPAAGYQTQITGGIYAKYKFFSVQLQPEFVHAQNRFFDGFTQAGNESAVWFAYYYVYNGTDLPERFGNTAYTKLFPGQSSVRFTFDPVSIGVSTENLWWGPGVKNSLLMSNTAPGFLHATLNTTRPVKTPVGSFETQLVSGKLENSGYPPLVLGQTGNRDNLYVRKPTDWRYLSGLVFTYNPKWVPGLFLGLSRAFQIYKSDLGKGFNDYFPVFSSFNKKTADGSASVSTEDSKRRDQLTSFFIRWLWTEGKAEVYFEYGKNDHNWDLRDAFLVPEHSRAYTFGLKKIYDLSKKDQHIQVSVEGTQLSVSASDYAIQRSAGIWYTHSQVKQGYTNNGQVLGAGIGPGGNYQTIDVSWFKGLKRIGFMFERNQHNQDLYYRAVIKGELRRSWVDYGLGLSGDWDYKRFLLSARVIYINQLNYQWNLKNDNSLFYWDYVRHDANNFQLGLNVSYRF